MYRLHVLIKNIMNRHNSDVLTELKRKKTHMYKLITLLQTTSDDKIIDYFINQGDSSLRWICSFAPSTPPRRNGTSPLVLLNESVASASRQISTFAQ